MAIRKWLLFGVLCTVIFGCLQVAEAKITTLTVDRDGRRVFHIESFGFETGGKFILALAEFTPYHDLSQPMPPPEKKFNFAFVLQRSASDEGLRIEQTASTSDACFHETSTEDENEKVVFKLENSMWEKGFTWQQDISEPGYYHLYFSSCETYALVGFTIEITQYNVEADGHTRNYLSAGESSLPAWFFFLSVGFAILGVIWVQHLIRFKSNIRDIHHLMTVVLVLKLLTVFFESFEYHSIKSTGSSHGWNIVYYVFSFLKGMMMFTVIVLIGTGWSYLKPFLTERDKQIMLAVIMVQAMVNLSAVVLDEMSPGSSNFLTWRDLLHLLDMICCCFILLPIVWSIRHLKDAAEIDGKVARVMNRLKRFRKFYVVVVSYIYFTRIIVFLLGATLPFEWVWLAVVVRELAALIFYAATGYLFRPQSNIPYLEISTEDDDEIHEADEGNRSSSASADAIRLTPL